MQVENLFEKKNLLETFQIKENYQLMKETK